MDKENVKIVDLYSLIRFCLRKWYLWMAVCVVCGTVGFLYGYFIVEKENSSEIALTQRELEEIAEYIQLYDNLDEVRKKKEEMLKTLIEGLHDKVDEEYFQKLEQYNVYTQFYTNMRTEVSEVAAGLSEQQRQYMNENFVRVDEDAIKKEEHRKYIKNLAKYMVSFMLFGIVIGFIVCVEVYLCSKKIKSKDEIEKIFGTEEIVEAYRNILFGLSNVRMANVASAYLKGTLNSNSKIDWINLGNGCTMKGFQKTIEKAESYRNDAEEYILVVEAGVSRYEDVKIVKKEMAKQIKLIIYIC